MNISVRSLYHMILENICMDVCVCVFFMEGEMLYAA